MRAAQESRESLRDKRTAILKPKKRGDRARDGRPPLIGRRSQTRCLRFCVALCLYRYYGRKTRFASRIRPQARILYRYSGTGT